MRCEESYSCLIPEPITWSDGLSYVRLRSTCRLGYVRIRAIRTAEISRVEERIVSLDVAALPRFYFDD